MTEPEYIYRKGEGWVPVADTTGRWKVIFHDGSGEWRNADHNGVTYLKYENAVKRIQVSLDRKARYIEDDNTHYYTLWDWKLVRAEEFPEIYDGGDREGMYG